MAMAQLQRTVSFPLRRTQTWTSTSFLPPYFAVRLLVELVPSVTYGEVVQEEEKIITRKNVKIICHNI